MWSTQVGNTIKSSPAVVDGYVYFGSDDDKVHCLYAENGTSKWTTGSTINGNVFSSPVIVGDYVYIGSNDNKVYKFEKETGVKVWDSGLIIGGSVVSSPAVYDNKIYAASQEYPSGGLYCLNDSDGSLEWLFPIADQVWSSPAIANDFVYIGSNDVEKKLFCVDAQTGVLEWEYNAGSLITSSPAVVDGYVYFGGWSGSGKVYCLDAFTGYEIWTNNTGAQIHLSSPSVFNGKVYIGSKNDKIFCYNGSNGDLIWSYTTGGDIITSPAIADGKVYIGSFDDHLYCLDANDGSLLDSYDTGSDIQSSPAVYDGYVFVGAGNKMHCFGENQPPETPNQPIGETEGFIDEEYNYTTDSVTDPDGDDVEYLFDWGNGENSGWLTTPSASYSWSIAGTYEVSVKARDIPHGMESNLSQPLQVTITEPQAEIEIGEITGGLITGAGLSVNAKVRNTGDADALNVSWHITLEGGIILNGAESTGSTNIPAGEEVIVSGDIILGLGRPTILVEAEESGGSSDNSTATGLLFLILLSVS
jgi:outer membrane protein assembly factor BamB